MRHGIVAALPLVGALAFAGQAHAVTTEPQGTSTLWIGGGGVSGSVTLTYDIVAGGQDPIVGISGAITDTALGILNQSVTGLIPIDPVVPLPDFVTAPDFSYISVPNGVPSPPAGRAKHTLSYDNYYYPGGFGSFASIIRSSAACWTSMGSPSRSPTAMPSTSGATASSRARQRRTMASHSRRQYPHVDPYYTVSADQYIAGGVTVTVQSPRPGR